MDSIHVYNNQIVKHGESAPVHKNSILYESYEHLQHLLGERCGGGGVLKVLWASVLVFMPPFFCFHL